MTGAAATLTVVEGNGQRLDGGAMFGNAPRALWSRWAAPDAGNRIPLATRAVLVREASGRTVLLEAGIGAFFPPELRERFGVTGDGHVLLDRLGELGVSPGDVDVVVLSHLHFDHAGGVLASWREGAAPALVFPRAAYVVSAAAWARAERPTVRDRASFIDGLCGLLAATGRVERLDDGGHSATLGDAYRFHRSDGHTPGLLLTEVDGADGPLVYASDLVPGVPWVHVPITMGYDRNAELVVEEKERLLADWATRGVRLVFPHDPEVASARLGRDERGRYVAVDTVAARPEGA